MATGQNDGPTLAAHTAIDVSQSEDFRFYTYPDGSRFEIDSPKTVYVLANGSHRVVDTKGITHRPTPGFVGISWKPAPDAKAYVV